MFRRLYLAAAVSALTLLTAAASQAQQLPGGMSIDQAVTLLQTNPGLQNLVRQRLQQSGLTRGAVRVTSEA